MLLQLILATLLANLLAVMDHWSTSASNVLVTKKWYLGSASVSSGTSTTTVSHVEATLALIVCKERSTLMEL